MNHSAAARSPWVVREADFPLTGSDGDRVRFLLRYAALAPSTRNTQPWRFHVRGNHVEVIADTTRWQRVADRDQRELEISIGCALENLIVAADHFGYFCDVAYQPIVDRPALLARVTIWPAPARAHRARSSGLFAAICRRHTEHRAFGSRAVRGSDRWRLEHLALEPGVRLWITDTARVKRAFESLNREATTMAYGDPSFRRELGELVGSGVFGTGRVFSLLGQLAMTHIDMGARVAQRDSRQIADAPLIALIATTSDTATAHVRAGQCFERLCLLATTLGLAVQPMSQALETPSLRQSVAALIPGQPLVAQQVCRIGYPTSPRIRHTPRRALETMITGATAAARARA